MARRSRIPAARRSELVLRPFGNGGEVVLKDPASGVIYNLGAQEAFLLAQFDGQQSTRRIRKAFEDQFGEPLSADDMREFVELAESRGFLQTQRKAAESASPSDVDEDPFSRQSLLYWRISFFDPDRLLTRMLPWLAFCWTRGFVLLSTATILLAAGVAWANAREMIAFLPHAFRWETVILGWLTIFFVT